MIEMLPAVAAYKLMQAAISGDEEDGFVILNSLDQRGVYQAAWHLSVFASRALVMQTAGDVPRALEVLAEWETVMGLDPEYAERHSQQGQTDE